MARQAEKTPIKRILAATSHPKRCGMTAVRADSSCPHELVLQSASDVEKEQEGRYETTPTLCNAATSPCRVCWASIPPAVVPLRTIGTNGVITRSSAASHAPTRARRGNAKTRSHGKLRPAIPVADMADMMTWPASLSAEQEIDDVREIACPCRCYRWVTVAQKRSNTCAAISANTRSGLRRRASARSCGTTRSSRSHLAYTARPTPARDHHPTRIYCSSSGQ